MHRIDALPLAQALIRRPSVTPADAGALDVLEAVLKELGFTTHRLPLRRRRQSLCPAGRRQRRISALPAIPMWCRWAKAGTHDPFAAEVKDGMLYGRGAADMKSAIAAFVAAAARASARPKAPSAC